MIHGRKPGRMSPPLTSRRWAAFRSASPGFDLLREDMVGRGAWPEDRFKPLSQQFEDLGLDQVSDAELDQLYPGVPLSMIPATHHISRILQESGAAEGDTDSQQKDSGYPFPDLPQWQDGVGLVSSKIKDSMEKAGASQQGNWGGLLSEVAESSLNNKSKDVSEDGTVQPEVRSSSALPDIRHVPGSRAYIYNDPVEGARSVTPFVDEISGFDWHRDRNLFNFVPGKKPEPVYKVSTVTPLGAENKSIDHYKDHLGNKWTADYTIFTGQYHGYKNFSFRGTGQFKGCQAVYRPDGSVMTTGPLRSTFDYGVPGILTRHGDLDIAPHNAPGGKGYRDPDLTTVF